MIQLVKYDPTEQEVLARIFAELLQSATKDGGTKREHGAKLPWWCDPTHEAAIFSHLYKWKRGEKKDADSGTHPLVHLAWRCLAIAYQETEGRIDPQGPYQLPPRNVGYGYDGIPYWWKPSWPTQTVCDDRSCSRYGRELSVEDGTSVPVFCTGKRAR